MCGTGMAHISVQAIPDRKMSLLQLTSQDATFGLLSGGRCVYSSIDQNPLYESVFLTLLFSYDCHLPPKKVLKKNRKYVCGRVYMV